MMLFLNVFAIAAVETDIPGTAAKGELVGQFMQNGKTPLINGRLYIYDKAMGPPSADRYVRVPDLMAGLDNVGKFSLSLAPGTYYLSAVKMPDAGHLGPPAEGEMIYFKMDPKGEIQAFDVIAGRKTDIGVISSSLPYKRKPLSLAKGETLVEGIVTDGEGAPVAGAIIFAYVNPDILDKSLFVSEKTGSNGKFALHVNDGGTYYLRVRSDYGGGTPKEGELVNINDPKAVIAVTLGKGEKLTGITIQVTRIPQRGPLYKGSQKERIQLGN